MVNNRESIQNHREKPHVGEPALWRDPLLWFTIGLTIFAIAPFLQPGYFWGANDARHHVYFLFEFDRLVQDGIWWPRWSPDFAFGYGYPFFNIYAPFSHFLAEIFLHFFGVSYTDAIEIVFGLSIVGSAGAMYAFIRSWLGRQSAVISALVYVYAPYHLFNLYVRGNLAESMAFVWLPLCLWCVRQTVIAPNYRWLVGLAVSYAGLMLTSNLVIVLFTPLLCLYTALLIFTYADNKNSLLGSLMAWIRVGSLPVLGGLAGLGLSAVFWIPAFRERQYVRVDQWFDGRYDFHGNFVYFFQLFRPQWGFGISIPGPDDLISFQIGLLPLALTILGLLTAGSMAKKVRWEIICFTFTAFLATFITLQWAAPLWDRPYIGAILELAQFPWRWFVITTLCISILSGLSMHSFTERVRLSGLTPGLTMPLLILCGLLLVGSYPMLQVQIKESAEGPVDLAGLMRFQHSSDEMTGSTAWVKEIPTWSPMADYYIAQSFDEPYVKPVDTKISYENIDYAKVGLGSVAHNTVMEEVYFLTRAEDQRIIFDHFYYPGWKAYLLDEMHGEPLQELAIIPQEDGPKAHLGRMTVPLPLGEGYVLLRYEDTNVRIIGKYTSLSTIALLIFCGIVLLGKQFIMRRAYRKLE